MRTALAFLQTGPDVLTSVVAPLEPVVSPRPGCPAVFAPEFSMAGGGPSWFHVPTDAVKSVPCGAFARQDGVEWGDRAPIAWGRPDEGRFAEGFRTLGDRLADGRLKKGVPVTVLKAELAPDEAWLLFAHAVGRIPSLPAGLYVYGWYRPAPESGEGTPEFLVGATPELLFDLQDGRRLSTMAVAGTRQLDEGAESGALAASAKDRAEHQSVVDDLLEQLAAWGEPSASGLEARSFGPLEHLAVDIRLQSTEWLDFETVARRLHPTPALGVYPRGCEGQAWLASIDPLGERKRFGAPFGLRWPTGLGRAVVAIRNLQDKDGQLEIGLAAASFPRAATRMSGRKCWTRSGP